MGSICTDVAGILTKTRRRDADFAALGLASKANPRDVLRHATQPCNESEEIVVLITITKDRIEISVTENAPAIVLEPLTRIFAQKFTARDQRPRLRPDQTKSACRLGGT
jgi:hypothetical protein